MNKKLTLNLLKIMNWLLMTLVTVITIVIIHHQNTIIGIIISVIVAAIVSFALTSLIGLLTIKIRGN